MKTSLQTKSVASEALPAHSKIGASSMHRWAACPGSVKLSEGLPNRASKYAEEGTDAHELAAYRLTEGVYDRHPLAENEEMLEAVEVYVRFVEGLSQGLHAKYVMIEHKFDLSKVHPGLYGTADCAIYNPNSRTLHVVDYKHGQGIAVEPEENEQLMYYGVGALMTIDQPAEKVVLHIVQPRCAHKSGIIRSWETTPMRLMDFITDLIDAAVATEDPNAKLSPGDHCRFCPASGVCPAIHEKATELAKLEFSAVAGKGVYDPEQLGKLLEWLPVLEGWVKGVRDFAYGEAEHGRPVPGWKLVAKRATRKWVDETKVAQFLENEFPKMARDFFSHDLKSPAQIEKILHKKQHEKLKPYLVSISSGSTLVPADDLRPEVKILTAEEAFKLIETDEAELFS